MIVLRQLAKGPYAGRWAWAVKAAPRRISNGQWAARHGIGFDETMARKTALRVLRWHQREELS